MYKFSSAHVAALLVAVSVLWAVVFSVHHAAADDLKLGDLNSYSRFPTFTEPYRKGWKLKLEEINQAGGLLGKKLDVETRDDGANTSDAVRVAEELVSRENVKLLFGTMLSNTGLALADFAQQKEIIFIAAEPLSDALTLEKGNQFTFRVRPSTYTQTAMLVDVAKKLGKKRWAIVAPNYEYGQSAAKAFKALVTEHMPDAEIVAEQYPALGKIDAGATVQALLLEKPDAIFNVLFGGDLAKFLREGEDRTLFKDREVVSLLTGEPEWIDSFKEEAPVGWLVTGYPWHEIQDPAHKAFQEAYQNRWDEKPHLGSLVGYITLSIIAEAIEKAGSLETEAMISALKDLELETPIGKILVRKEDHQATMGAWVGRTKIQNGLGVMSDWHYAPAEDYMISAEDAAKKRPAP